MTNELFFQELIFCYATNKVANIAASEQFNDMCNRYNDNIRFNELRKIFEENKVKIEKKLDTQTSSKAEVEEALRLLYQKKKTSNSVDYSIAKELIQSGYLPNWTVPQQRFFNDSLCVFENCNNQYFLSFTSKKTNPNQNNIVHLNHKCFIKHILQISNKEIQKAETEKKNLLAEAIDHLLKASRLNGFYYPYHTENNAHVKERLKQNCDSTFTFIQLIQNIIFNNIPETPNYCHWEYQRVKDRISKDHRFYILAERSHDDLIKSHIIHEDYEGWHTEIANKDKLMIEFTETHNAMQLKNLRIKIEKNLCKKIEELEEKLFLDVPD